MAIAFRGSSGNTATNGNNASILLTVLQDGAGNTVSVQDDDFVVVIYCVASTADRAAFARSRRTG